ncbi:MAG: hypothetical protein IKE42_17910 [Aquamicrobium sp.]|jgi:hypothetical protein|uniref:DUF680 domain-containing protein n=1 Tax=Mesorhizobium sp. Pch-S TaxID=2082387 RepID=UPI0010129073|nr:DUF680 domain-containing protein [Mesorhizobium sp. Pch-S]MBR2689731.1 hypothetical protein [Aquamicrobium sp.]MCC5641286.1 DUF680 domain-containing protein [Nostoc sp. CHAB 5844]QAZ42110.1 hypothetical protein C1M53_03090 [Mesorhizobium sp. Pch-S]
MKTLALTAAALLVASGAAFAGSDNFDPYAGSNPYKTTVDAGHTASIATHSATAEWLAGGKLSSADKAGQAAIDYRVDHFGNR